MKRCAIYARVSTADQAQVKDGSLDTQLDLLQDAVKLRRRSGDAEWWVVGRYREEAIPMIQNEGVGSTNPRPPLRSEPVKPENRS